MKHLGPLAPIVTPCDKAGNVDSAAFMDTARDLYANGCASLFVCGSTGRGPWFSGAVQERICAAAREVRRDTLLFAGCLGTGIEPIVENAKRMAGAGADVAVITAPFYFRYNTVEVERILLSCADRSPIPVLVYDIPDFANVKLDTGMLLRLASHQNIAGLKDSSSDMERFRTLLGELKRFEDFFLLQGKEPLISESLTHGASGFVVSFLHFHPKPFSVLMDCVKRGAYDRALQIQGAIDAVYRIVADCMSAARRPETSTLFFMLERCMLNRGLHVNLTLAHEGEPPQWIVQAADEVSALLERALAESSG